MVFNQNLIFIHIGKTGGMSCTRYLLEHLELPVYNGSKSAEEFSNAPKLKRATPLTDIHRHCTLAEALKFIRTFCGKTLGDFKKVIAVIRHPYTLEYSYYRHIQKPHILEKNRNNPYTAKLAKADFKTFINMSGYHRRNHPQESFFLLENQVPDSLELVRFEELSTTFPAVVAPFIHEQANRTFPGLNQTNYATDIEEHLSPEIKKLIYEKHKYMFDSGLYDK